MVIKTEFKTCEEFEDYLYFNGLSFADNFVVSISEGTLEERIEFNDMDLIRCPDGKMEITFTKSCDCGEDYVTVNTERVVALESESKNVAWFNAFYHDEEKNIKILHFGVDTR